ncbi:MAG TPA: endonuclease MutS2 [Thermodesulfovibrionales bacterium]|nr:endonuclease MutS2 [Thermodesulfovibrionales bacterium]
MIPETTFAILEFRKLLGIISQHSNSEASSKEVLDIRPLYDKAEIEKRQGQISEIRRASHQGKPVRLSAFHDISGLFARIKPEGSVLEAIELSEFIPFLDISLDISLDMRERHELPNLKELTDGLTGFPDVLNLLKKSINSEGNILDSASFLLADLRKKIRKLEIKIRKSLEDMVRDERISTLLQDNFVTVRSGRWVIPVRMDSKGMVPGVVHDVSKSGETAFIEPLSIINLANELENLNADQRAEEIRILRNICSRIRTVASEMESEFRTLVYLDVLNSIALFADLLHMETPSMNTDNTIVLRQARHPLLQLSLKRTGRESKVVPLDVELGGENTVMVITGANAGGKTISIKTIGLLLLMAMTGMPVPADSSSSFPLSRKLLADIGDEQSIEDNLSTFSAHISNISQILREIDRESLILIDELGTGTDPEEGGALACAILQRARQSGALVFATTHLSDIKGFVHRTEGMVNASMEFDQKTFTPLYRLRSGEPGQSHALEMAKQYGMPDILIDDAKRMMGSMKLDLDRMIADLNEKRARYERELALIAEHKSELDERTVLLDKRLSEIETKSREALAAAYREASAIVSDTKRQMALLLEEMKRKDKEHLRKAIKEAEIRQDSISEKIREYEPGNLGSPPLDQISKGEMVFVRSLGHDAKVLDVNARTSRIKLSSHNMEIEVPLSDIGYKKGKAEPVHSAALYSAEETAPVSNKLHLVGKRVDEALGELEQALNHASLAEMREIIVIHGIGKGLLRRAIHEHLTGHPLVRSFRNGAVEEGGVGVTFVTLK